MHFAQYSIIGAENTSEYRYRIVVVWNSVLVTCLLLVLVLVQSTNPPILILVFAEAANFCPGFHSIDDFAEFSPPDKNN